MSVSGDRRAIITITRPKSFDNNNSNKEKKKPIKKNTEKVVKKPSDATLQRYGLTHSKPLQLKELKDELILSYRLYTKKQEQVRHANNLKIDILNKYKIAYTDLQKRLYTDNPPDDVCAVTDIDSDYFTFLTERSIGKYTPLYKSLKSLYSNSVRIKQEIGYRNDYILQIEAENRKEMQNYNESLEQYKNQVKQFDQFVSEDYKKSMEYLQKCENFEDQIIHKSLELETLATQKCTIMSKLIGLDYLYGLQQKYGRFLYYLSPPSWRAKHREFAHSVEIEAKGFDFGASGEEDTFAVIFEKMRKECYEGLVKPPLYFTQPEDLINIFDGIEQQQLHHFSYVTFLAPHAQVLKNGIKALKDELNTESAIVKHMVQRFEKLLEFFEERATFLEARVLKIINGMFYDSVGAPEVLKLGLHIDFCYEKVYNDKPNMDMFMTAKALVDFYMEYCFKLDQFQGEKIKQVMKKCVETEKKKMKLAKLASRELRSFGRLEKELLKAFKPVTSNEIPMLPTIRKKQRRSKVRFEKTELPKLKDSLQYELTDAETEYLSLFTEWTESEDPANYLQSLAHCGDDNNDNK